MFNDGSARIRSGEAKITKARWQLGSAKAKESTDIKMEMSMTGPG